MNKNHTIQEASPIVKNNSQVPRAATCTLITAIKPGTVTKEFKPQQDGSLDKKTTAHVTEGKMEIVEFSDLEEFSDLLVSLKTNQCLMYGVPPASPVDLVTEEKWKQAGYPSSQIARTKNAINWQTGPGILMLDYDPPKNGASALSREQLLEILFEACPGMELLQHLWWPSTSSCIYHGDKELTGIRGQRIYILVQDANDIARAGHAVLTRLWAKGHGCYEVSKSGALLERGLFDASVWQPNRIDFAAGAKCHGDLQQKRGDPVLYEGVISGPFDSKIVFPDPADEEVKLAEKNKTEQKALVSEEVKRVREEWKNERVNKMLSQYPDMPRVQLENSVLRAVERRNLMGDWLITVIDNETSKEVSVLQILENKEYYHGMVTLDPLEPDYDGGRPVGKLFLDGARPCLHSMAHGGATFTLQRTLSRIEIVRGKDRETTDALLEVLRLAPNVYDFGAELVVVEDNGKLMSLDEHSLRYYSAGLVQFWRWHKMPNSNPVEVLENPPKSVLQAVLALRSGRKLKELDAVISAPTFRPNGSVLDTLGYDAQTRLLLDTDELIYPVPDNPTRKEALEALDMVCSIFKTFPFVSPVDQAVHLCAVLTAAVRPVLSTAPAFAYDAPVQGSGKTLLARCIGVLATGNDPDVWPHTSGRDDEETRKRLFTALRSGARVIVWDNVVGTFDSAAMASFLTSDRYRDRILGKSESSALPNRAMLVLTGNNLSLAGDMARRVLISRIDPQTDKPFARSFDIDPLTYCKIHRQKMTAAALTLIRFYLSSGIERPSTGRMASFELWDDLVRQTAIYIGNELAPGEFGDVMDQVLVSQTNDPEQEALGGLLHALESYFGDKPFSAADVINAVVPDLDDDNLKSLKVQLSNALDALNIGNSNMNAKSLGKYFKYRKDRIVDGLKITIAGNVKNTNQWRVECCSVGA